MLDGRPFWSQFRTFEHRTVDRRQALAVHELDVYPYTSQKVTLVQLLGAFSVDFITRWLNN
jgi:hypothetical protein